MADYNDDIERYHAGLMTPKERHALEKKALSDPFLADALEGSNIISPEEFSRDLLDLRKKIDHSKNTGWFTPLRIAAGVLLILGAGTLFFVIDFNEPSGLALQKEKSTSPVARDSTTLLRKDSSKTLLTLATEEKADKKQEPPKRSSSKAVEPASEAIVLDKTSASSDAIRETQPTEIKQAEAEEDKPVVKEEMADEQKLALSIQPAPSSDAKKKDVYSERKKSVVAADDASVAGVRSQVNTISGKVTSSEDGSPMPGVNVIVKGTNTGGVTDSNGNFHINSAAANPSLVFSFIGMETVEKKIPASGFIEVKMNEDAAQLSEVVVTALGIEEKDGREPVIREASPVGGIRAYNKYLENNVRYPAEALPKKIKGKVTVEFTVGLGGDLSDFNVVRSLGSGCDEEVIRLVKEGPKWSPTTQDDVAVETQVRVRVKFDPAKAEK